MLVLTPCESGAICTYTTPGLPVLPPVLPVRIPHQHHPGGLGTPARHDRCGGRRAAGRRRGRRAGGGGVMAATRPPAPGFLRGLGDHLERYPGLAASLVHRAWDEFPEHGCLHRHQGTALPSDQGGGRAVALSRTCSPCRRTRTRDHPQAAPVIIVAVSVAARPPGRHPVRRSTARAQRGWTPIG